MLRPTSVVGALAGLYRPLRRRVREGLDDRLAAVFGTHCCGTG